MFSKHILSQDKSLIFFLRISGAMQSVMAEEMRREQMRREYEVEKKGVINSAMLL